MVADELKNKPENIADHKKLEEALRKSEEKLKRAYAAVSKAKDEKLVVTNTLRRRVTELEKAYTELQDSKDELVRSEKLAFTGQIAANIAHEIRNPLANVLMSLQQLKKAFKPRGAGSQYIELIMRNLERINFLITELLNCARPPKLSLRPSNIHKVLRNVLELTKSKRRSQKVKVIRRFTSRPSIINIDKERMERAFLNIVNNAIEAMSKGGEVTVITEGDENFFVVRIKDTGKGIPEKDIMKIYDPFFSSKADGVGLGLNICYGIIVSHGGTIEVESKLRRGSTFTVSLPVQKMKERK